MIVCPNCNNQHADGTAFCTFCGTKLAAPEPEKAVEEKASAEAIPTPPAKEDTPIQSAQEINPVKPEKEFIPPSPLETGAVPPPPQVTPKSPFPKKALIIGAAGIALVVFLAVGAFLLSLLFGGGDPNYAMYIKDKEIFFAEMPGGDPWQITERLDDTQSLSNSDLADSASNLSNAIHLTEDGKTLFYFDKVNQGDDGLNLYYRSATNPKKPANKLDSDVTLYSVSENGKLVTYLKGEDGDLYQHDLENREKIDSDVSGFRVTEDGKRILYFTKDKDLYLKDKGKNAEKLDSEISSVSYVSEELDLIYYIKDDSLYQKKIGEDKVKIASDVATVHAVFESGEAYYSKKSETENKLSSFVEDDMKDADAAMVQPQAPEYVYYSDYENYDEYLAARDKYYEDYEKYQEERSKYYEKQNRDELREDLEEETLSGESAVLYYYNGKEEKALTETLNQVLRSGSGEQTAILIFSAYKQETVEKVKLSRISSVSQLKNTVQDALFSKSEIYFAHKGDAKLQDLEDATRFRINEEGTALYFLADASEDGEEYDLYKAAVSDKEIASPELYDSDVSVNYLLLSDEDVFYFKDVKEDKGDLYKNKEMVDWDVYKNGISIREDGVYYLTDWNSEKEYGTLKVYRDGEAEKIADDIHDYTLTNEGEVLYLYDYNTEYCRGEVYLYRKGKAKKLDDDVIALLSVTTEGYKGTY